VHRRRSTRSSSSNSASARSYPHRSQRRDVFVFESAARRLPQKSPTCKRGECGWHQCGAELVRQRWHARRRGILLQDAHAADGTSLVSRKHSPASARAPDRLLTIGNRCGHACGMPLVWNRQARARGIRPPLCFAPHHCSGRHPHSHRLRSGLLEEPHAVPQPAGAMRSGTHIPRPDRVGVLKRALPSGSSAVGEIERLYF
jgi:hypothetical protein